MIRSSLVTLAALAAVACTQEPPEPPVEEGPTRADTVALATATFDPTAFDTIAWETPETALERGRLVFRISCSKCHGNGGDGDGGFMLEGDTLRPPSFLTDDWRFADDPDGLRRQIFTGTVAGMPYWGLVGLKYRDIDAVAHWIREGLRQGMR